MTTKSKPYKIKTEKEDTLTIVSEQQLNIFHEYNRSGHINGDSKNKLNAVSLFTGAGGLDIGFKEAGFNIVFASDIMPQAEQTFNFNFPYTPFIKKDIRLFSIRHYVEKEIRLTPPHVRGQNTNNI